MYDIIELNDIHGMSGEYTDKYTDEYNDEYTDEYDDKYTDEYDINVQECKILKY